MKSLFSSAARGALRAGQRLLPQQSDGVTILCYHLVDGGTSSPVDLDGAVFRRQMEEVAESGAVVSLSDAVEALHNSASGHRVVLTFDDAYANFAESAWPVLDDLGLPATLCVPIGFLDGTSQPPIGGTDLPPISWNALRDLVASGRLTISGHSWTHPDMRTLTPAQYDVELGRAREVLEERLETTVRSFCYPRARWSSAAERYVARHYDWALVGGGRRSTSGRWNPHRLERVSLRRDMPTRLGLMLRSPVWMEEKVADLVRNRRP